MPSRFARHLLAGVDAAGTVSYLLNDQVGQPQKMLNTAGKVPLQ